MQVQLINYMPSFHIMDFPSGSVVKNLPAMQETLETWVQSLGQEDSLEKEMATHSSILAWRIPWTEVPGGYKESNMTEPLTTTSSYQVWRLTKLFH